MKHIIIIKFDALGDIVMTTPILTALKAKYPDASITWLVDARHQEVLQSHPMVDHLVSFSRTSWEMKWKRGDIIGWWKEGMTVRRELLRQGKADAVVNYHPEKLWTLLFCPSSLRIGVFPRRVRPLMSGFYTYNIKRPKDIHNTDYYLLGIEPLKVAPSEKKLFVGDSTPGESHFFSDFMAKNKLNNNLPLVVFAPFTSNKKKDWDIERYAKVIDSLYEKFNIQAVITMTLKDKPEAKKLAHLANAPIVLAEGTDVRQYVSLLRRADLVISSDSSAMHLAAALDTPFVVLFGPTSPHILAPLVGKGIVLPKQWPCTDCKSSSCENPKMRQCLNTISEKDVVEAATAHLTSYTLRKE